MITINPIKLNSIKPISFGNGSNVNPSPVILTLQNDAAKIQFEKEYKLSQNADAVQQNPIKALGYKFLKTYNILFSQNENNSNPKHISFLG